MIVKKKWTELTANLSDAISPMFAEALTLATQCDEAFNTKYGFLTNVSGFLTAVNQDFFSQENNVWQDLDIFMSSFKFSDKRFIYALRDRLSKYLKFITKMINEEGIKRKMNILRNFSNGTISAGTDKNYFSETPQAELDNFENALIRYASNLGKNESNNNTTQSGNSSEGTTSTNWDEEFKNLEFAFYNELVDFITRIPDMIYMNYCTDSRPFTNIRKDWRESLRNLPNLL